METLWDVVIVTSTCLMTGIALIVSTAIALYIPKISVDIFMDTHQTWHLVLLHVVDFVMVEEVVVLADRDLVLTPLLLLPQS